MLITECITLFGNPQQYGQQPLLNYFEIGLTRILSDVQTYSKRSRGYTSLNMDDETAFLLDIADIKTELNMIRVIMEQQQGVLEGVLSAVRRGLEREKAFHKKLIEELDELRELIKAMQNRGKGRETAASSQNTADDTMGEESQLERSQRVFKLVSERNEKIAAVSKSMAEKTAEVQRLWRYASAFPKAIREAERCQRMLDSYLKRIEKINKDADLVEKSVQDQLELKRSFAAMRDANASLAVAISVIGFTVVTIIFTPLSFITGLYQLPLKSLAEKKVTIITGPGDDDNERVYPGELVAKWFCEWRSMCQSVSIY